jgi:hypothetical protein
MITEENVENKGRAIADPAFGYETSNLINVQRATGFAITVEGRGY